MTDEELIGLAARVRQNAYAPYSDFAVGAAVFCASGQVYTGCNIENSAFGAGICAERVAVYKAISNGEREFLKLAVISDREEFCYPCGICRQVLFEFSPDCVVLCCRNEKEYKKSRAYELLPDGFRL
ncbi:Cytidine deaminase [bioreactor metagenome]|uniref:cytidine deaminase n=1 Tax=bioreactor metagenome TaxID=1076179 RepID=A0A645CG46_9ZZZZ